MLTISILDKTLTHICLVDLFILINWKSPFPILGVAGVLFHFYSIFDRNFLLGNSTDPDQTPQDLGLHCPKNGALCLFLCLYTFRGK